MSYGYTVEAPMDNGYIPNSSFVPGRPDMPDASLPVIAAASTDTLGRRNTLAKALPAMPASEIGDLSFTNYRQVKAFEDMQALAVGQADRKFAERQNRAVSKYKNDQAQKIAEKDAKPEGRSAYKRSKFSDRKKRNAANRIAQGLGALHVMFAIR